MLSELEEMEKAEEGIMRDPQQAVETQEEISDEPSDKKERKERKIEMKRDPNRM